MILKQGREIISEGLGESFEYGIDADSMSHVFKILRDSLYSDKILAFMREYSTNGYEAHQLAGIKDRALRVHLPTSLDSTFKVRDFGDGLSPEEVRNIYTRFGKSTKRSSNDFMGCLGFGSKAGFAYGSNFTVISYHKGTCTVYEAYLDSKDQSCMTIISSLPTKETGIEVSIPIRDQDRRTVIDKASGFYAVWDQVPEFTGAEVIIRPHVPALEGHGWGIYKDWPSRVRMGQITYLIDKNQVPIGLHSILSESMLIEVPIGEITHTPSRESLEYTHKNVEYLSLRLTLIEEELRKKCEQQIFEAKTRFEAMQIVIGASNKDGRLLHTIWPKTRWHDLPVTLAFAKEEQEKIQLLGGNIRSWRLNYNSKVSYYDIGDSGDTGIAHGYGRSTETTWNRMYHASEGIKRIGDKLKTLSGSNTNGIMLTLPKDERAQKILALPELSGFKWSNLDDIKLYTPQGVAIGPRDKSTILKYNSRSIPTWESASIPSTPGVYLPTSGYSINLEALPWLKHRSTEKDGYNTMSKDGTWFKDNWKYVEEVVSTVYGIPITKVPPGWITLDVFLKQKLTEKFLLDNPNPIWESDFYGGFYDFFEVINGLDKIGPGPLKSFLGRVKRSNKYANVYKLCHRLDIQLDIPIAVGITLKEEEAAIYDFYPKLEMQIRRKEFSLEHPSSVRFVQFCETAHKYLELTKNEGVFDIV